MISEEDIKYVKEKYMAISTKEIAEKIGKSIWTVYDIAKKLDIGNYKWTEGRIEILKNNYSVLSWEELFILLETTDKQCIQSKASEIGVHKRVIWNDDFDNILKCYYPSSSWDILFDKIPNLTINSAFNRAKKLKIVSASFWTEEELDALRKYYPLYPGSYIKEKYLPKREIYSINQKARLMGIKKSKEQNNKFFVPEKMIEDLRIAGEQMGRTPSIEELHSLGLPSEKSYDRYIGGYKKACNLAGLEINISLWGNAKIYMSKNNDVCYSHSELLITNFFIDHNILYEKEKKYSALCGDDILCKSKRMDWFVDNGYVVEYWGYPDVESYIKSMNIKKILCEKYSLKVIDLTRKDKNKLSEIFKDFIK